MGKACELRLCLYKLSKFFPDDAHITVGHLRTAGSDGLSRLPDSGSAVLPTAPC
ncbi:hypothetical protein ABLG96_13245 [Nakamurella sp. A5-74]|uniref:Uncharacterized protein n=1 Tax=Nakamurella sp. A5-74 TaxID=3158264 RepID=A0AAU8DJV0_9ACTN